MIRLLILFSFLTAPVPPVGHDGILEILGELDKTIDRREQFSGQKERRIMNIKEQLASDTLRDRFVLYHRLFDEYRYYQYDSAYVYARKLETLAVKSGRLEEKAIAESALLFCFKSVGFFNEATDVIDSFSGNSVGGGRLTDGVMLSFYILSAETYQNLSSYVSGSRDLAARYDDEKSRYYRKALEYAQDGTYEHAWISLELELLENYSDNLAIDGRKRLIAGYNLSEHDYAVQYSILSSALGSIGREEESLYYRTLSAIYDIRSCTRETTSAKALAEYFYMTGDISRAYRYIQQALYDARFYNSRLRMIEINTVLPKIENSRYDWINNQRMFMMLCTSVILLFLFVITVLFLKLRRSNGKLTDAHKVLVENTDIIRAQNVSLSELNMKLKEANEIKDEYIIQSLYGNSYFINEVEKQSTFAVRKIMARQYDDALALLHNMGIRKERERMYSSFDSAFLKLFPNFIDEFNRLFPEDSRICMEEGSLPMEVRIFALLRLGIDNTSQVAEYLNLSVNTVYVYKTKVKSKSSVPKEEFENRIKAIPKP